MVEAGINDKALLVVDRSLKPKQGDVVIAAVNGELTCKILDKRRKQLRAASAGHAPVPLDGELEAFWGDLGYAVIQGYGLTETAPIVTLNHPLKMNKGSVGTPIAGVEIRIAEDGEILIKGRGVMKEYYKRPDATAEVLKDGWFATGDIGELDADNYLRITDRKKDLIKTSGGKYIAPQNLENELKADPLDRKSTRLNSSHIPLSRMPSSA